MRSDVRLAIGSGLGLPATSTDKCFDSCSTGTSASTVKLYGTNPSGTTDLASYLNLTVSQGTGGSFGSCAGFTPLAGGAQSYASGLGSWTPTGQTDETRTFRLVYRVDADAPDSTQGGAAAGGLTWEAQNS